MAATEFSLIDLSGVVRFKGSIEPQPGAGGSLLKAVEFAHDTPGIDAGIALYTPAPGEWATILYPTGWLSLTEAFDGDAPTLDFGWIVGGVFVSAGSPIPIANFPGQTDEPVSVGSTLLQPPGSGVTATGAFATNALYQEAGGGDSIAVKLTYNSGAGTTGKAAFVFCAGVPQLVALP